MSEKQELLISYLSLRTSIGSIGTLMPGALVLVAAGAGETGLRTSISSYYYSSARDILVGSLCSIGVFLMSYRGYDRLDRVCTLAAGIAAIGVAIFPVGGAPGTGFLHLASASLLFVLMAGLCMFQFPKGATSWEKRLYHGCGFAILVSIAAAASLEFRDRANIFWPELAAIEAFGMSWLVKGKVLRRLFSES